MENTSPDGKGLLQNDRLLVCGMLVFYGLCFIGLGGAGFWSINQRGQTMSANATEIAQIMATLEADGTATAVAYATELADYEFFDPFDVNINRWRTGAIDNEDWRGSAQVASGVYIWNVTEVKQDFVDWADFPGTYDIKNYDASVDTKFEEVSTGQACSGLIFRKSFQDTGKYSFAVCEAGFFIIYHYDSKDGWEVIHSEYHPSIQPSEWNRLEVQASDSHFVFQINKEVVYETDDERQLTGGVALMIDADDPETKILFDNFSYQNR